MEVNFKDLCKQAVEKWGNLKQLDMVVEECAELINAIQKRKRKRGGDWDIVNEAVDVEFMLGQLEYIINSPDGYKNIRARKLQRLETLLEGN